MSRVQLALNVDDLDEAVTFYSKLFNTQPAKLKEGYANFAVAEPPLKLVLLENPGKGGTINHLGVEVESSDTVHSEIARLAGEGLFTDEEIGTTCCFATQDKVWVTGPAGEKWEVYTVLSDSETFGTSPQHVEGPAVDGGCVLRWYCRGYRRRKGERGHVLLLATFSPRWVGLVTRGRAIVGHGDSCGRSRSARSTTRAAMSSRTRRIRSMPSMPRSEGSSVSQFSNCVPAPVLHGLRGRG